MEKLAIEIHFDFKLNWNNLEEDVCMNDNYSNDGERRKQEVDLITGEHEGRESYDMDVDRMVNEGLGGGYVTEHNGLVDETTTDSMGIIVEQDLE